MTCYRARFAAKTKTFIRMTASRAFVGIAARPLEVSEKPEAYKLKYGTLVQIGRQGNDGVHGSSAAIPVE